MGVVTIINIVLTLLVLLFIAIDVIILHNSVRKERAVFRKMDVSTVEYIEKHSPIDDQNLIARFTKYIFIDCIMGYFYIVVFWSYLAFALMWENSIFKIVISIILLIISIILSFIRRIVSIKIGKLDLFTIEVIITRAGAKAMAEKIKDTSSEDE